MKEFLVEVGWNLRSHNTKNSVNDGARIGCAGGWGEKRAGFTMAISTVATHILYQSGLGYLTLLALFPTS